MRVFGRWRFLSRMAAVRPLRRPGRLVDRGFGSRMGTARPLRRLERPFGRGECFWSRVGTVPPARCSAYLFGREGCFWGRVETATQVRRLADPFDRWGRFFLSRMETAPPVHNLGLCPRIVLVREPVHKQRQLLQKPSCRQVRLIGSYALKREYVS